MADEASTSEAEVDRPGAAAQLTDRDRDLLGLLVLARYLTAAQVHRLAFDGRNLSVAYRRLLKLSRTAGGQPAFVRQRFFRTYDGARVGVWAATPHAMNAALARAGTLPELPKHDVGAQFLEHLLRLNDVFIDLWRTGGRCPKAKHPVFRWVPSDRVRLNWDEYEARQGRTQQRIIQPDAVLELRPPTAGPAAGSPAVHMRDRSPAAPVGRRLFLECEMGTQTIVPGKGVDAPGATLTKAERYQRYLTPLGPEPSAYSQQYRDGFAPEVLYLVQTPGRAASVNAALAEWQKAQRTRALQRAVTFEDATAELRTAAGLPAAPAAPVKPAAVPPRAKPVPPPPAPPPRPKREVTSAEVRLLTGFVETLLRRFQRARAVYRDELKRPVPEYPEERAAVEALLARWTGAR